MLFRSIQFTNESTTVNTGKYHMITLENVVINGSRGSGLTLKSENMTAINLSITNSGWKQSIDVQAALDKDKAVNPTWLKLDSATYNDGLQDLTKISNENPSLAATVIVGDDAKAPTHSWFMGSPYSWQRNVWADGKDYASTAASIFGFNVSVQNSTGPIALHTNLTAALANYVDTVATVPRLKAITLTNPLRIEKAITSNCTDRQITAGVTMP